MEPALGLEALLCQKLEGLAARFHEPWALEQEKRLKELQEQLQGLVEASCAPLVARQREAEGRLDQLEAKLCTTPRLEPAEPAPQQQPPEPAPQQEEPEPDSPKVQVQPPAPRRLSLLATVLRASRGRQDSPPRPAALPPDEFDEALEARFDDESGQGACWDAVQERERGFRKGVYSAAAMLPRRAIHMLCAALLLLSGALPAALYKVPWLVLSLFLVLGSWLLYLAGEKPLIRIVTSWSRRGGKVRRWLLEPLAWGLMAMHNLRSSPRREQQIRSILGMVTTIVVLFNPDVRAASVIRDHFDFPTAPVVLGSLFVFMYLLRALLTLGERGAGRNLSEEFGLSPRSSEVVQVTLQKLRAYFKGDLSFWRRRGSANSFLNDLQDLNEVALNELLAHIPNSLLVQTLGCIEGTVSLLCMDRADDLTVGSKSRLLHALMCMQLTSCSNAEAAVENLLLTTGGDDLSRLKCVQDGRGDIHSVRKLVFQDIRSRQVQTRVLDHFLVEGLVQVAHRTLLGSGHFRWLMRQCKGHQCMPESLGQLRLAGGEEEEAGSPYGGRSFTSWLKIVFDIDDTLMCSGGNSPAGIDTRYPKHAVYPGFTALLRELQGNSGVNQLVALSARPHMFGDIIERGVFQRFSRLMELHGLPTMPDLLPGALDTGIEFMISGGDDRGMRALAKQKLASFAQYLELYPEFRIVFFGDNGQGDYAVGREMHRRFPDTLEQVWIHKVQRLEETPFYTADFDGPVEFVDDYVMAAISAATRQRPLITPEGLRRVVLAAAEDFARIDNWLSTEQREAEERRLSTSFAHARQVLQSFGICEAWMQETVEAEAPEQPQGPPQEREAQGEAQAEEAPPEQEVQEEPAK